MQAYQLGNNPGFARAYVSLVNNFGFTEFADRYKSLEKSHKGRVLVVWGQYDTVIPTNLLQDLIQLIPSIEHHIIMETSHSVIIEKPIQVVEKIQKFIQHKT